MKKIIIVFEYDYDDCDIVLVPDFVADDIEKYTQLFFDWLAGDGITEQYYMIDESGKRITIAETDGFVGWLNKYVCPQNEQASVVDQHIKFEEGYPIADF